MADHRQVTFSDEVIADGGVYRRFSDGVEEWRWRDVDGVVWWRDSTGRHGTDEPLLGRLVKRAHRDGAVRYGRDLGFGWTNWSDRTLTLNATNLPAGPLAFLIRLGPRALLGVGVLPAPPAFLTPAQEEKLRRTDLDVPDVEPEPDWLDRATLDHDLVDTFG